MAFITSLKSNANYLTEAIHQKVREKKEAFDRKNVNSCQLKDG
jgi:hypothetical protein